GTRPDAARSSFPTRRSSDLDAPKLPTVVGYEVAGEIDQVGSAVTDLRIGQRVIALTRFGGHSDVVVVPAGHVVEMPEGLSFEKGDRKSTRLNSSHVKNSYAV